MGDDDSRDGVIGFCTNGGDGFQRCFGSELRIEKILGIESALSHLPDRGLPMSALFVAIFSYGR